VTRDDPKLDYVPTQILAETFRRRGFDGILYRSLLDGSGLNVALFDVDSAAKPVGTCLYHVKSANLVVDKFETVRPYGPGWHDTISSTLQEIDLDRPPQDR